MAIPLAFFREELLLSFPARHRVRVSAIIYRETCFVLTDLKDVIPVLCKQSCGRVAFASLSMA